MAIGEEINAATRPLHTTLNRLILSFLPLCLPPVTTSPDLYANGMTHILPIYSAFEMSIHRVISSNVDRRRANMIKSLRQRNLERTARLQDDLLLLHKPTPSPSLATHLNPALPPNLRSFLSHISTSTAAKPHLLIAYTWIFYLALFSGGRYLRTQLRIANTQAWRIGPSTETDPDVPLQFWCFAGDQDGEDLKAEFKACVESLETQLTLEEREEVVEESVEIMKRMIAVVQEIATTVEAAAVQEPDNQSITTSLHIMRLMLPFSLLKTLGSWSWSVATGWKVGLEVVGRGIVS